MDVNERSQLIRWTTTQLVLTLVQSLVLAVMVRWVVLSFGQVVSIGATWAVALVAVAAVRLQRLALPGTGSRRQRKRRQLEVAKERASTSAAQAREPVAALPETVDRRFRRLARHTDRLTYAVVATRHYESGVRPVLAELARDRLRRHHGIDMTAEPDRAREVMGDDLWQSLTSAREQPPTTTDLSRWLTALERLSSERTDPHSSRMEAPASAPSWHP